MVHKNPEALHEYEKFKRSNAINSTLNTVSHRLGFNYSLNFGKTLSYQCIVIRV